MPKKALILAGLACIALGALVSGLAGSWPILGRDIDPPGLGLAALALFDLVLVYSLSVLALELLGVGAITGRVQWIAALLLGILGILAGLAMLWAAVALLTLMVSLFLAIPFGLAAYIALFGHFDTATARMVLSAAMTLKIGGLVLTVLAAPTIPTNKPLMALVAVSLALTFGLGLVHGWTPNVLVSIVDTVAAIIFAVVAIVWWALLVFSGIGSVLKGIRSLAPG